MRKTIGSQSSPSRSVCSRKWNSFVLEAAACALSLWLYNLIAAVWNLLNSFLHKSASYPRGNLGVYCICVFNLLYYLAKEMYVQISTVVHVLFFESYTFWRISYICNISLLSCFSFKNICSCFVFYLDRNYTSYMNSYAIFIEISCWLIQSNINSQQRCYWKVIIWFIFCCHAIWISLCFQKSKARRILYDYPV